MAASSANVIAPAAPCATSSLGAVSFSEVWSTTIWPVLREDYNALLRMTPSRLKAKNDKKEKEKEKQKEKKKPKKEKNGDAEKENEHFPLGNDEEDAMLCQLPDDVPDDNGELCCRKIASVLEDMKETGERRNVYMNLAWTGPCDNTRLQSSILYDKVANMAIDMFMDTSKAASADGVEASATAECDDMETGQPAETRRQVLEREGARPWRIPDVVEKGFEIPICITDLTVIPERGVFKRLAMDVVVNAVWLALYWAKQEGNAVAVSAVKSLILDWPMDFVRIQGHTPEEQEENKFKWSVNFAAKTERLRDFVGLETSNLMRIVAQATAFVKAKLQGNKKANAEMVHTWLCENIKWGTFQCPEVGSIQRHMSNWDAIEKNPKALALVESAVQRWGRNNLLDWPTKLAIIVQKTDLHSLAYVAATLYVMMWRKNNKDPFGAAELKKIIADILWQRSYLKHVAQQSSAVFTSHAGNDINDGTSIATIMLAKSFLDSPLDFFLLTESPERDPTWLQSLPTAALRCLMKHALEVSQGLFQPEIRGALTKIGSEKYDFDKFQKCSRVAVRFTTAFRVAFDSLVGQSTAASAGEGDADKKDNQEKQDAPEKSAADKKAAEDKKKKDAPEDCLTEFRGKCEKYVVTELEARVVSL